MHTELSVQITHMKTYMDARFDSMGSYLQEIIEYTQQSDAKNGKMK